MLAWGGLVLAGLVMAFAAAAEASMAAISRANVRRLIDDGVSRAQALQTLLENPPRFVTALMVLKAAAFVSAAGCAIRLVQSRQTQPLIGVPLALVLVAATMLCLQIVARALAVRAQEAAALRMGSALQLAAVLLSPITSALRWLGHLALGKADETSAASLYLSEDGLRFLFNVSDEPGLIEADEREMIASIFELSETVAREVMVPRIDIVAIEEQTSLSQALEVIVEAGHSRIPVYRDHVDNILGVLYAKDLLRPLHDGGQDVAITELMRPAYFVPESKKVNDLLRELQRRKVHMAIIVDEYGGTAGVVTIEDLVEEIVGEIQDEYDSELPRMVQAGEDEYLFDARIDLDAVSKILAVELPDEDSDTLGGFIFSQLGRVPVVGSVVRYEELVLEVQSVSGRRIQQVRVTRVAPPQEAEEPVEEPQGKRSSLSTLLSLF